MQVNINILKKAFNNVVYSGYEYLLTQEIKSFRMPEHVAIIMDGNRRFARKMGFVAQRGHIMGADTTERVLDWCYELGVKQLTVYAFSLENLNRSETEKKNIFDLMGLKLDELIRDDRTHQREMRVRMLGNINLLPPELQKIALQAEEKTRHYSNLYLNIAMAYGGRQEIVDTARIIAGKVARGDLSLVEIDENTISSHLYPSTSLPVPDVDLIIRTGGDVRVSNFLPWQACGNECAAYFCAPYWPEFRKIDFLRSIRTFQTREIERQKNTVVRIIKLLGRKGKVEVEEVVNMSLMAINITADEVLSIIREMVNSNEIKEISLVW